MSYPDFVTHYHPAGDPPFRNLSELPEGQREAVITMLAERRRQKSGFHRVFGPKYIEFRLETEKKLRRLFVEAGGQPQRVAPHYFVLGHSKWFEGLYPDTKSVEIPLSGLDAATTSVTYPDSFVSMRLAARYGIPLEPAKPFHERAYLLSELPDLVCTHGMPHDVEGADYSNYAREPLEKFIEVQLWSDDPVREYLA